MTVYSKYYHWHKNEPEYKAKRKAYLAGYYKKNKEELNLLKEAPCTDCKQTYPHWVMEFDHRDASMKVTEVGKLLGSKAKMQKELDKCDLVCANCHANRTYQRRHLNG